MLCLQDILLATQQGKMIADNPYVTLMKRQYRPQLLITILVRSRSIFYVLYLFRMFSCARIKERPCQNFEPPACVLQHLAWAVQCVAFQRDRRILLQMPLFQQFPGINAVIFYSPIFFCMIGGVDVLRAASQSMSVPHKRMPISDKI